MRATIMRSNRKILIHRVRRAKYSIITTGWGRRLCPRHVVNQWHEPWSLYTLHDPCVRPHRLCLGNIVNRRRRPICLCRAYCVRTGLWWRIKALRGGNLYFLWATTNSDNHGSIFMALKKYWNTCYFTTRIKIFK